MTKRYLVLFALLTIGLLATQASALDWDESSFYAQGAIQLPMGDFGDIANLGFGPGFGVLVPHSDELSFRGQIAYYFYSTEDVPGGDVSVHAIPLLALVQYNLEDSPVYLLGGLGLTFASASYDYDVEGFGSGSYDDSETKFTFTAGAGYPVAEKISLEARFNLISDANSLQFGGIFHF